MREFIFLASLCSWTVGFESNFFGNPDDRFSHDEAHIWYKLKLLRHCKVLTNCIMDNFSCFCCRLLTFFKMNFFQKFFQEHHHDQSVKQLWSRSALTFCLSWSGSKRFAKVISRRQGNGYHFTGVQLTCEARFFFNHQLAYILCVCKKQILCWYCANVQAPSRPPIHLLHRIYQLD